MGIEPTSPPRGLKRFFDRLVKSNKELESDDLMEESSRLGATHIRDLPERTRVTVVGTARTVTLRPRAQVPAVVVELYDGSDSLNLVWIGRREIGGVRTGTTLRVKGLVCRQLGVPTIYNPSYEIIPVGA